MPRMGIVRNETLGQGEVLRVWNEARQDDSVGQAGTNIDFRLHWLLRGV